MWKISDFEIRFSYTEIFTRHIWFAATFAILFHEWNKPKRGFNSSLRDKIFSIEILKKCKPRIWKNNILMFVFPYLYINLTYQNSQQLLLFPPFSPPSPPLFYLSCQRHSHFVDWFHQPKQCHLLDPTVLWPV